MSVKSSPLKPRLKVQVVWVSLAAMVAAGGALAQLGGSPVVKRPKALPPPGAPGAPGLAFPGQAALAGLDAASLAAFVAGREEFVAVETPAGGLGPIFNDASCGACHKAGGVGGASERTVTRFGRMVNGRFDPMEAQGGSLLQARAIDPAAREFVPAAATVVAQRVTTPLFGAGLIEAISDDAILMNAQRSKPDGVKGRAAMVTDPVSGKVRVGRFGWKAQQATLLAFSGDAYVNEMGVTNRLFPKENAPNGRADLLARFDRVPDIEDAVDPATGKSDIDRAADFMRLLAPLPTLRATAASLAGARVFEQAGCAACHQPTMATGPHAVPALSNQTVALYSDLLLHDMGRLGDGIEQGPAGMREMRTAPLWGLRARPALLHDGRAKTIAQAIEAHDGEAAVSRDRYKALKAEPQRQLLEFLRTL
ncbi:MAG: di-heme oxidoredictase family protein [Rubrivivax sp.]